MGRISSLFPSHPCFYNSALQVVKWQSYSKMLTVLVNKWCETFHSCTETGNISHSAVFMLPGRTFFTFSSLEVAPTFPISKGAYLACLQTKRFHSGGCFSTRSPVQITGSSAWRSSFRLNPCGTERDVQGGPINCKRTKPEVQEPPLNTSLSQGLMSHGQGTSCQSMQRYK